VVRVACACCACSSTDKIRSTREEKEQQQATMQNELARIHVDTLNTRSHNSELEQQLAGLNADLGEKDSLVQRYQLEARRRQVEIEKKQHELDLLNKKFDTLMKQRAGVAELDEDAGPLEATIVHLKREINTKMGETAELQRTWIKMQTELVTVQNTNQSVAERLHDYRAKLSILGQKHARIEAQFEKQSRELRELERGSSSLHNELSKINTLLAEHATKQQALADDNYIMEHDFVVKLKELEAEAVNAEGQIVALKEQKEALLLDVTEAEKQLMLLEKKIALERETQAALDPEVGAAEVRAMEREIHRMRLRYAQLQRRQEQMIAEMERAIYKRDNIEAKGKTSSAKKGAPPTHAVLAKQVGVHATTDAASPCTPYQRPPTPCSSLAGPHALPPPSHLAPYHTWQVNDLSKKLQGTTHDANLTQLNVLKLQETQQACGAEVEAKAEESRELQGQVDAARDALLSAAQLDRVRSAQMATQQKLARKLTAAAQGRYEVASSEEALRERIAEADDTSARLLAVVEQLSTEQPKYAALLSNTVQAVLSARA
jgi:chromosome segregation ATPase